MAYYLWTLTSDQHAKEVKLFGLGPYLLRRYRELAREFYVAQRPVITGRSLAGFSWGSLTLLTSAGTYLYVALQAVAGRITLGDVTLYTQAAGSLQGSLQGLLGDINGLYEGSLYLSSLFDLLNTRPRLCGPPRPVPLPHPLAGSIAFEHVSFRYEGRAQPVLSDVSFCVAPGETVAVVGGNGAGKSTLIKLLFRLYDPTSGRVVIDGHDIRDYDPDALRMAVGAVFQDYSNYQMTAQENVGLGWLEFMDDLSRIRRAADCSGADAVVEDLPQGYATMLGRWFDGGVNLSGGEWQKMALARAFLRDARILALDEPSAALDAQAEHDLFQRLRMLATGRTTIFISHRFSTVRQADRILVIEGGALVEQGTHDELMALVGRYAHLFSIQAAAYLHGGYGEESSPPDPNRNVPPAEYPAGSAFRVGA